MIKEYLVLRTKVHLIEMLLTAFKNFVYCKIFISDVEMNYNYFAKKYQTLI